MENLKQEFNEYQEYLSKQSFINLISGDRRRFALYNTISKKVTVLEGSYFSPRQATTLSKTRKKLREKLIQEGYIKNDRFVKDYTFNSPSQASGVCYGSPISGNKFWKLTDGTTLGDYLN